MITVRGRRTGQPHSTPVAMLEVGGRRFVQASFGEAAWVRNVRVAGELVLTRGGRSERVAAVELSPEDGGTLLHDTLASCRRMRLLRSLLGPTVRPPAAILYRYHFRIDETLDEDVEEARRHPLFELRPLPAVAAETATHQPG